MSEELNATQPQVEEVAIATENTPTTPTVDNTNQATDVAAQTEQPKIKVKYNHQDMELPYEEAVQHIQKGMNYEKAIERTKAEAHQAARDAFIVEQGYEWNGKPISTEAEYKQALKEQELYEQYKTKELPEEVIQELIEGKRFREQLTQEKQTVAQQRKQEAEYKEFFEYFANENGRNFDPAQDVIPEEVWLAANKGKTLLDAYQANEAKSYKAKIKELESQLNANKVNEANASTSTGSVTGNGTNNNVHISYAQFEANRHDQSWVNKNFKKIMESRAKW